MTFHISVEMENSSTSAFSSFLVQLDHAGLHLKNDTNQAAIWFGYAKRHCPSQQRR
jgi:hypothetical protein